MNTVFIKMYIRHSLLAILKQTQAAHPDKIDAGAMALESKAIDAWVDELVLTWMD